MPFDLLYDRNLPLPCTSRLTPWSPYLTISSSRPPPPFCAPPAANLFIGSLIFIEELADKIVEAVAPVRDSLDACLIFPSMPAVMKLNKLGTFSMSQLGGGGKSAIGEFMKNMRQQNDNFEEQVGWGRCRHACCSMPCVRASHLCRLFYACGAPATLISVEAAMSGC